VKGAGNRSWRGRAKAAAELLGPSTWLRGAAALAALDTALNAIDTPAFIVDLSGDVLHANTNAQALLNRDRQGVSRSLIAAIAGAPAVGGWHLTPLRASEQARGFLVIMRPPRHEVVVQDLLRAASRRWRLTARQTEVLRWVAHGLTNVSIAETLGISDGTVEFHLKTIFDKAGVDNRATLIVKLMEM
jgi:DNA-binding CsgD family transcriptional regulator